MSEDQPIGERRRRREAERAGASAAGDGDRPLTRRELRARDQALATGALELGETGEIRVVREVDVTPPQSSAAASPVPTTGAIDGRPLTRRQLRALRGEPDTGSMPEVETPATPSQPAPGSGSSGNRSAFERPTEPPAQAPQPAPRRSASATGVATPPGVPAPAAPPESSPAPEVPAAPQRPSVSRRPVVRPPVAALGTRALTETGLSPITSTGALPAGTAEPTTSATAVTDWSTSISIPEQHPVPDPGPLPTSRRTRRAANEALVQTGELILGTPPESAAERTAYAPAPAVPPVRRSVRSDAPAQSWAPAQPWTPEPPSMDELITGETEEPTPFGTRPSWSQLPPATPPGGITSAVEEPLPGDRDGSEYGSGDARGVADAVRIEDDDDEPQARTPIWLTALMVLVLVLIGIVLGLLIWRMWSNGAETTDASAVLGLAQWARGHL